MTWWSTLHHTFQRGHCSDKEQLLSNARERERFRSGTKLTCLDLTYLEDTFCSKITLCLWPGGLQTTRYQINIFLQSIQLCQKVFLFIYAICSSNSVWVARQPFSHENKMKVGDVGLSPLCGHLNGFTNKCQYCAN